jgi:hypothetical protein
MICEHCGSKVVDGGQVCAVCGMATSPPPPRPREVAKVVPFRPKKRTPEKAPQRAPRRRMSSALWWIIAIVVVALVVPYILPLR